MRPSKRAPDELRKVTLERGVVALRRGLLPRQLRRDEGAVHGLARGRGAALAARLRQGLGHGRICDAAARHARAHAPRGHFGQALRPHAGDPAPDRPFAARGRQPAGDRRAADHGRLRRDPGRWRHPHRRDHGRLGGAPRLLRLDAGRSIISVDPLREHVAAVSCGIVKGMPVLDLEYAEDFGGRDRRQFRDHRLRRPRRGAGHGRGRAVLRGRVPGALAACRGRASTSSSRCRRRRCVA